MQLLKTTITPKSNFITTLKGDTLFGQLCWMINYKFGEDRLKSLLDDYETSPFMIVSDGFVKDYLPKPYMPSIYLNEDAQNKKENRKKKWLKYEDLINGTFQNAKTNEEAKNSDKNSATIKNSINYKTFTTDNSGQFSPYGLEELSLSQKDIYVLIDESRFTKDELEESFKFLSQYGYGKDSTIGKGRFEFDSFYKFEVSKKSNTFMSLSPVSPKDLKCRNIFYEPFTRFGKHGASLANKNPFKKPLLLANSSAVIEFDEIQDIQYIGKAIRGHSSFENTVHQGYSIVLPIKGLNNE